MSKLREAAQAVLNDYDGDGTVEDTEQAIDRLRAALAQPETDAGVSWDGHNVRGDADSIAEVRRLIDFEQARQGAKPATGDDLRVYDAIAANYVNAEPEPVVIGPEWTPCVKLPVTVHVREQRPGEQHVSTREGIAPVKPDDLIMRGVAGEEYPIGRELFEKTYRIGAHPPRDEWRSAVHEELFTSCIYSAKHARDPRAAIRDIIDWNVRIALDPAVSSDAQALIDKGRAMGDEWRPASEPPEDGRDVVVWMNDGGHGCFAIGHCLRGEWTPNYVGSPVTHWRDIDGPTEGER